MKNIVLCFLSIFGIIDVSMAKDVYIQLQNNKYQMQNICFSMNKITDKEKKFARYYKFIIQIVYLLISITFKFNSSFIISN